MFGMNWDDFWIFSRSGRDGSEAVFTPTGLKRVVCVLIVVGFLVIKTVPADRHVCLWYNEYRQIGLSLSRGIS
jgi:hypothetical protein